MASRRPGDQRVSSGKGGSEGGRKHREGCSAVRGGSRSHGRPGTDLLTLLLREPAPARKPILISLLASQPGGPGPAPPWRAPPSPSPSPSPAHHSEALLASRLRSLGSKNRCHLGAETDGKRWPPAVSILAHSWLAWQLTWLAAGRANQSGSRVARRIPGSGGGWQHGMRAPGVAPAAPLTSTPQAPAVERDLCCQAAGPHTGPSAHCTPWAGPVTCLVCASCSSSRQCPPPASGKDLRS